MPEGKLIVLEGVDGAGTTTHAGLLREHLRARAIAVHATAQPSQGPIGGLLRQALTGRVVSNNASYGARAPAWTTMALLFAADRMDHLENEILPNLAEGRTVVCDCYDHSSVAYQSVAGGGPEAIGWIRELNRHARRPDLTLVLCVPPAIAAERRKRRQGRAEIFDDDRIQQALGEFYTQLGEHFPGERIEQVDADGSIETVAERIRARVDPLLGM